MSRSPRQFIAWELTDEAQLEGLAKNNILPSRPALADNKYFAADPRVVVTAKAIGVGYVPWVYHFADMVNSDSSPWINMLQRAIFDGDVDGAIKEARAEDEGDRRRISRPASRSMRTDANASTQWQGWLFMAPALLFVAVFVHRSRSASSSTMSLTDRSLLGGGRFIGFDNYLRIWRDAELLARARVHRQIHARPDADPDGPRLCAGAADRREHAAQAADPHDRVPARGDRPVELEPALVLAARRAGRPVQQAARRPARHPRADRLVRHRRSRLLGGGDLDHLEGRRLRHGAVRRGHPVDQSRHSRGGGDGRRGLLEPRPPHHPAADPPGAAC